MPVPSAEELEELPLHQRIKKTRDGLGLSQVKFGREIGVSERQVKRWESATHAPTRENGERIATLAERPPELFTPPEEPNERAAVPLFEPILGRLGALEAKVETQGEATAKSVDALARDIRALTRELKLRGGQAKEMPG